MGHSFRETIWWTQIFQRFTLAKNEVFHTLWSDSVFYFCFFFFFTNWLPNFLEHNFKETQNLFEKSPVSKLSVRCLQPELKTEVRQVWSRSNTSASPSNCFSSVDLKYIICRTGQILLTLYSESLNDASRMSFQDGSQAVFVILVASGQSDGL